MHRPLLVLAVVALLGACADDAAQAPPELSAAARAGFSVAQSNGCFACHGDGGVGGAAGPALVGLAGSTVQLDDGTTAVADTAYLRRAIAEPAAQKTEGYVIVMPVPAIAAEQVDSIITWLEEAGSDR